MIPAGPDPTRKFVGDLVGTGRLSATSWGMFSMLRTWRRTGIEASSSDTHIWLWSKLEPKRLGRRVNNELSNVNNELLAVLSERVGGTLVLMQKGRVQVRECVRLGEAG